MGDEQADFDRLSAGILAGRGLVARYPGVVCVADAVDTEPVRALVALCAAVAGFEPGRPLARRLAAWLSGPDAPSSSMRFGTLADAGDRWAVFLYGAVSLHDADADTTIPGADAAAWTDRLVSPGGPLMLLLDPAEEGASPQGGGDDPYADLHDLRAGTVPGRGVVLATTSAARHAAGPPPPAAPAEPVAALDERPRSEPAATPSAELDEPPVVHADPSLGRPAPEETPNELTVSDGSGPPPISDAPLAEDADFRLPRREVRVDEEYASEPLAPGRPLSSPAQHDSPPDPASDIPAPTEPSILRDDRAVVEASGARPPLGLLVFDDGTTYPVDAEYLVGRMPDIDERVQNGSLRSIVIEDRSGAVSRVHAEVRVDGWDVLLVDSRSRNGTHVAEPGATGWTAVPTGGSHRLTPGTRVRLGSRTFLFESPAGAR